MALNEAQIKLLERALDHQYVELLEEVREEMNRSGDSKYIELLSGADAGEEAVRDLLWGLNSSLFERHIQEIQDIEDARNRMRESIYGLCSECGEEIGFRRLENRPVETLCQFCSEENDRPASYRPAAASRGGAGC